MQCAISYVLFFLSIHLPHNIVNLGGGGGSLVAAAVAAAFAAVAWRGQKRTSLPLSPPAAFVKGKGGEGRRRKVSPRSRPSHATFRSFAAAARRKRRRRRRRKIGTNVPNGGGWSWWRLPAIIWWHERAPGKWGYGFPIYYTRSIYNVLLVSMFKF